MRTYVRATLQTCNTLVLNMGKSNDYGINYMCRVSATPNIGVTILRMQDGRAMKVQTKH